MRKGAGDKVLARELALYARHDGDIYRQRLVPFAKNYAAKRYKGQYSVKRAVDGLANNLARDVIIRYWKENASGRPPEMNKETKRMFGAEMLQLINPMINDYLATMKRTGKIRIKD